MTKTTQPHPAATAAEQAALRRMILVDVAIADATQAQTLAGRLAAEATTLRIRLERHARQGGMDERAFREAVEAAGALRAALQRAVAR